MSATRENGIERLRGLVAALPVAGEGADPLHKVHINDLSALPLVRQQELKAYKRRLIDLFADVLLVTQIMVDGIGDLVRLLQHAPSSVSRHRPSGN